MRGGKTGFPGTIAKGEAADYRKGGSGAQRAFVRRFGGGNGMAHPGTTAVTVVMHLLTTVTMASESWDSLPNE
jgi:hypothetical protein